ncbi:MULTISPECIES: META domain-containing protein [Aequorivita]|uniref:META domain-containing protein n=2 Tax=Aequorivita TaxID=153265 RepID=A0AB35YV84_9FLAO|nr:META domain-containing protein [Aequorivita sp. Ant34-E75]WGF93392.1 META domain-containing protein [Aequorivita sp. Ant34-E75]
MKFQFLAIVLASFSLFSCGTTQNNAMINTTESTSENTITETHWVLETLGGEKIDAFKYGNPIGFKLNDKENRINGFSGCNSFFGNYSLEAGNRISFSSLGATKMACLTLAFNEADLLEVFNLADNYSISGDKLSLNVGKRAPLAVFKKATETEPITEKYWKLKTLEGQEVKMAKNQEKEIYFMLKTDDNKVVGFAGCNTFSGNYTLQEGNRIQFSQMATTMMACPDLDINEAEFLKVFELADNFTIQDDVLSLNVGRRAPLAVFEAVYFN